MSSKHPGREAAHKILDGEKLSPEETVPALDYLRERVDAMGKIEMDEPGLKVGLLVWDKTHGGSTRVLERAAYTVQDTRDLQDLPDMGFELGQKILDGMILHHIGRLRSEDAGRKAAEGEKGDKKK